MTANGISLKYHVYVTVKLDDSSARLVSTEVPVVDGTLLGFDLLLGMNAIQEIDGICITKSEEMWLR